MLLGIRPKHPSKRCWMFLSLFGQNLKIILSDWRFPGNESKRNGASWGIWNSRKNIWNQTNGVWCTRKHSTCIRASPLTDRMSCLWAFLIFIPFVFHFQCQPKSYELKNENNYITGNLVSLEQRIPLNMISLQHDSPLPQQWQVKWIQFRHPESKEKNQN